MFEVIGLSLGRLSADAVPAGTPVELAGRGTVLAYDMPGPRDAPTLLLLHGLGASGRLNWFPAFGPLSEQFRVVAMDLRGHGHGLHPESHYPLVDCADDAIALMDALEIERCIPVGYSLGGPVAQLIWRHHRDRVDALVFCATSRNFSGKPYEKLAYRSLWGAVTALRLAFVVATLAGGWGVLIYLALWIIMPVSAPGRVPPSPPSGPPASTD